MSPDEVVALLIQSKDDQIKSLKDENVHLRTLVSNFAGITPELAHDGKPKEIKAKIPLIYDEKEQKWRNMSRDEQNDYSETLREITGIGVS